MVGRFGSFGVDYLFMKPNLYSTQTFFKNKSASNRIVQLTAALAAS